MIDILSNVGAYKSQHTVPVEVKIKLFTVYAVLTLIFRTEQEALQTITI